MLKARPEAASRAKPRQGSRRLGKPCEAVTDGLDGPRPGLDFFQALSRGSSRGLLIIDHHASTNFNIHNNNNHNSKDIDNGDNDTRCKDLEERLGLGISLREISWRAGARDADASRPQGKFLFIPFLLLMYLQLNRRLDTQQ